MTVARYFSAGLRRQVVSGQLPAWLAKHSRRDYIIACTLSKPLWADAAAIRLLRDKARRLTRETGIPHVLDHEIPVSHPYVCGLSVHYNMRVVPYAVNAAKNNKWHPDQMELFNESQTQTL